MSTNLAEVTNLIPEGIPEAKYKQFRDCQGWLAWLLKFCISERKHLKTKRGLKQVSDERMNLPSGLVVDSIKMWHTYLIMFLITFHESRWTNVNLEGFPKMPDYILVALMQHNFFDKLDIEVITKNFRLLSRERKVLKEVAMRMSP